MPRRIAPPAEIARLVEAVLAADAELRRQPEVVRAVADRRTRAVRRLVDACGGNAREAARQLGWPAPSVYRIAAGRRTSHARKRGREPE